MPILSSRLLRISLILAAVVASLTGQEKRPRNVVLFVVDDQGFQAGCYKYIFNIASGLAYPFASDLYGSPTWQSVRRSGSKIYGKRTVAAYLHRARHELYDLEEDPHEIRNLAGDPKHGKTLASLQAMVKAWQKRTKDPWLIKWKYE